MAFSLLPREDQYFALFSQMSAKLHEAAKILVEMFQASDTDFESLSKKIKHVEHECDELTHTVTTKLNKSFITPFDREDIYTLAVALDDICDYIDAGVRAIVMYDIQEQNQYSRQLARIIKDLGVEINGAVSVLIKPSNITERFREIHRLENE